MNQIRLLHPRPTQFSCESATRTDWLLLAGFCIFLFFYGLNQFGLLGADEPRYAQVARAMLERHDWITPTLGGKAWLEKPVLYYWQAMLAYGVFGVSDGRRGCRRHWMRRSWCWAFISSYADSARDFISMAR